MIYARLSINKILKLNVSTNENVLKFTKAWYTAVRALFGDEVIFFSNYQRINYLMIDFNFKNCFYIAKNLFIK